MSDPTISLCMIVKNEEDYLADCLESAKPFVDEIVVVDTGSTDRTVQIAGIFGAKLFHFAWCNDFAAARNESLLHATGDWILVLDADERLTQGSGALMKKLVQDPAAVAYVVKLVCPKQDHGGMVRLGWLPRLFRNRIGVRYQGIIHEQVVPSLVGKGKIVVSEITLDHRGYLKNADEMHQKALRNIQLLERQVREDPQDAMAWFHLAEAYNGVGRLEEAVSSYRKAIHLSVLEELTFSDEIAAVAYQNLGSALVVQGNVDQGISAFLKALSLMPDLASVHIHLGQAYYHHKNDLERCIEHFTKAIEVAAQSERPDLPFQVVPWLAWHYVGSAQAKLGRFKIALESFQEAVRLNPEFKDAHWLLGLAAIKCGLPAVALEALDAVRRLGGDEVRLDINLGSVRGALGDLDGAVQEFQSALAKDPGCEEARFHLCRAYRVLGRWTELLEEGKALLEAGSESVDLYRLLADACMALQAWPQAVMMVESLLAISEDPVAEQLLAQCRRSAAEVSHG
ncbi:MAG TPA: tetratricopeptide repeat protein [Methylomirabilota bacterium]|nr:tetratricopeptide repeat protein [Methylomirabilota bacterium]